MGVIPDKKTAEDLIVFAKEDDKNLPFEKNAQKNPWKILIVDDEDDVHEITRITLRGYTFEDRGIEFLSAYNADQVKTILAQHSDISLILLDVVMEEDDTGLKLVEFIRKTIGNHLVRIVLRTGQPGKAPEQDVVLRYDINDYKTKPELTAQKLFTSVTACLRAYANLKAIEDNTQGLEAIIHSSRDIFKTQSFNDFGNSVLSQFDTILSSDGLSVRDSAFLLSMPSDQMTVVSGTGKYQDKVGQVYLKVLDGRVSQQIDTLAESGGDCFLSDGYISLSCTKEGFVSALYLNGCSQLSSVQKKMIQIYANTIAIALDNISLNREITNTQKEVILTLGEIVETRSQETAHHVTRVAEICYILAKEYGIDDITCETLRLAAPMHDVGKIAIPEAILNKPGKLTPEEFDIIKGHTRIGYEILNKSNRPIMKTAAVVALEHHERWDGKGYPQGLAKENINILGRITAVADVFDALSHKRCYKDAWVIDRIVDLFEKESGTHFDPKLISIFLSNIEKIEEINKRFPE